MDAEANLSPRRGCTHHLLPRVGCVDIKICLYDVVSLETHSNNENMFIGDGRIDLSPEHLKPFRSARVSDRFQFMKAGVGAHDSINPSRVRREDGLREVQEVRAVAWCRGSMLHERADREAIAGAYIGTSMDSRQ